MGKRFLILLGVVGVVVVLALGINELLKFSAIKSKEEKIMYSVAYPMRNDFLTDEITYIDEDDDLEYTFYGLEGECVFNGDGTITMKRKFNRNAVKHAVSVWTKEVETTEKYKIVFSDFFYFDGGVFLKTENGDFYSIKYDYADEEHDEDIMEGLEPVSDKTYSAPDELKNMITSTVYEKSSGGSGGGVSGSSSCPVCNGSGYVKYNYGESDLEAELSGHDPYTVGPCPSCN